VARPVGGAHLAAWHAHTAPIVVGGRVQICFPWSEGPRDGARLTVEIDPGRGFGTGAHPTTRLLLDQLVERVRPGDAVLDVGSGSGVLAVVAARLGASPVRALDIYPDAVVATLRNAQRNGVAERVEASEASLGGVTGLFDVVVANIFKEVLVESAGSIVDRLRPGGWLGLSGLSPSQVSIVQAAYRPLEVVAETRADDWVALVLRHPDR
jgi:ribosomal protein L11 methyltransferase